MYRRRSWWWIRACHLVPREMLVYWAAEMGAWERVLDLMLVRQWQTLVLNCLQSRIPLSNLSPAIDAGVIEKDAGVPMVDTVVGRISYWSGKVNAHTVADGRWVKDDDCTSGANIDPLTYCRKFYPAMTAVIEVSLSPKPPLLWNTDGCSESFSGTGVQEWKCQ